MREIFYSFLVSCLIFTIFSCGKTTEENVNDAVSKTNDTLFGSGGGGGQCTSGVTFHKNIFGYYYIWITFWWYYNEWFETNSSKFNYVW